MLGVQTIDRYGWRPLDDPEQQATITWNRARGTRMGVTDIPATYPDYSAWFTNYEAGHLRRTSEATGCSPPPATSCSALSRARCAAPR